MAKSTVSSPKRKDTEQVRSVVGFIPVVLVVIVVVLVTRNHPNAEGTVKNAATKKAPVDKHDGVGKEQSDTPETVAPEPQGGIMSTNPRPTIKPETESAEKQRSQTVRRTSLALKSKLAKYWRSDKDSDDTASPYATVALHRAFLFDSYNDTAGLAFMGEKLARAIKYGTPIVVGMIGSSVIAGHDNCQYDSFSSQLQRTLQEVFDPAGIKVEVRNAGQGGGCQDSMENQIFCLRHMLGDDVDFTVYSWTFFESGSRTDKLRILHEAFVRWSLMMDRAPSPILMYAGGCTDKRGTDTVTPANQNIFDSYGKYGFNILCMTRGVETLGYVKGQTGVTTSGKRGFWGAVGDGLHNITRYGEKEKTPERRYSLGVMFRNWHPGPLAFQAVSDAYTMRLLAALDLAFVMLETPEVTVSPKPRTMTAATLGPNGCQPTDSADFWIDEALCDSVPACANHEMPTYGKAQITYAKAKDASNPMQARFSPSVSEWMAEPSGLIPREERDKPGCAHYDFCRGFRSDFMTYKVPPLKVGYIVMCFIVGKKADVATDGNFYLDSKKLALPGLSLSKNKCIVLQERWSKGEENIAGEHYVSVDLTSLPDPHVSHVFGV